jgi:nucleoside-diphosphate-sugar epimerase
MRVLVVGGTAFIGPPTVRRLLAAGCEVALFHRGNKKETANESAPESIRRIVGDRKKLAESADALRAFAPDVVLDMVLMTEPDAKALMDVFRGVAKRLVVLSSIDVYRSYGRLLGTEPGPPDPVPLFEDSPLREKLYPFRDNPAIKAADYDKILVERVVQSEPDALPAAVLRLPMVFGPGDYQRRLFPYLKRMDDGRAAIPLGEKQAVWRTSRGFVENVAEAISRAVLDARSANRTYNVADAHGFGDERAWVEAIAEAAGWRGRIVEVPDERLADPSANEPADAMSHHLLADASRIRRELELPPPVPLADALRATVAWERRTMPTEWKKEDFDYGREDAAMGQG